MKKTGSIQTDIHDKGRGEILKRNSASAGKTTCSQLRRMTGSKVWAAETGRTNYLLLSKKKKFFDCSRKLPRDKKKKQDAEEVLESFVNWILDSWIHFVQILCPNIYQTGKQINKKPESVITEMGYKNGRVLTSWGKIKNFTVTTCCNPAS